MKTGSIGRINFDDDRLQGDIEVILSSKMNPIYSEYSRGNPGWRSAVLFNFSGSGNDAYIQSYETQGRYTDLGNRLEYLKEIIEGNFRVERLQWARVLGVQNGLIMPHRDYIDVSGGLIRLHIPIQTDDSCMNSQEASAFHMAKGKIWFLDARKVHSAACLSDFHRIHLCLDFEPCEDITDIFKDPSIFTGFTAPPEIDRAPLSESYLERIYGLSHFFCSENFVEVTSLLGRVHFLREVDCRETYNWLTEIALRAGDQYLIDHTADLKKLFLGGEAA